MRNKDLFGKIRNDFDQGDKTNSLTQSVMKFIKLKGGAAFRVNTNGIPIVINGSFKGWRKSTNPGAADIRAIIDGYSIDIEIKSPDDDLNPNQKLFKSQVEAAKGKYWMIRNFDEFLNYYNYFFKNHAYRN